MQGRYKKLKEALNLEVKSAIEDLRDKHLQLSAQEKEFEEAMSKCRLNLGNLVRLKKI